MSTSLRIRIGAEELQQLAWWASGWQGGHSKGEMVDRTRARMEEAARTAASVVIAAMVKREVAVAKVVVMMEEATAVPTATAVETAMAVAATKVREVSQPLMARAKVREAVS